MRSEMIKSLYKNFCLPPVINGKYYTNPEYALQNQKFLFEHSEEKSTSGWKQKKNVERNFCFGVTYTSTEREMIICSLLLRFELTAKEIKRNEAIKKTSNWLSTWRWWYLKAQFLQFRRAYKLDSHSHNINLSTILFCLSIQCCRLAGISFSWASLFKCV